MVWYYEYSDSGVPRVNEQVKSSLNARRDGAVSGVAAGGRVSWLERVANCGFAAPCLHTTL